MSGLCLSWGHERKKEKQEGRKPSALPLPLYMDWNNRTEEAFGIFM